jgi:GAF domain-containing protein
MKDKLAIEAVAFGDDAAISAILDDICRVTQMGFAAVARVTEDRWIACQVLDKIEFGLDPGDELDIKKTICDEIRASGQRVVIDNVTENYEWRTHPVPIFYGFKSYVSLPILFDDGEFFGTLCAIDPGPRMLSSTSIVALLEAYAAEVGDIVSAKRAGMPTV